MSSSGDHKCQPVCKCTSLWTEVVLDIEAFSLIVVQLSTETANPPISWCKGGNTANYKDKIGPATRPSQSQNGIQIFLFSNGG
ncbi:hypothetical protein EYF80_008977 [Liparis tanakae]|uniref:Uncharacterized protein n=1 Tax=Liparis tanakae TaxID=230148 RepID=A0A4Z2IU59_9TELE|nr:hypothetical protein EYF80_008977 [Liparis tanakae]